MEAKIEELQKEGQEFVRLKKASDNERWPDSGTPSFIISRKWLDAYKEYIFFDACTYNQQPDAKPDHVETKHPGKIANQNIL